MDNPPPCVPCRDQRLAAEAADAADIDAAHAARRAARACPHGRPDGRRVLGVALDAARVCPDCDREDPPRA